VAKEATSFGLNIWRFLRDKDQQDAPISR